MTQKHPKSGCRQHGDELMIQISKTYWPFFTFFWSRTDHLPLPIDRARSQLPISFLLHCGSYSVPNGCLRFPFLSFSQHPPFWANSSRLLIFTVILARKTFLCRENLPDCRADGLQRDHIAIREKIFLRLFARNIDFFRFPDFSFKVQGPRRTLRVLLSTGSSALPSYTLKQVFAGPDTGHLAGHHFWHSSNGNHGKNGCDSVLDLCDPDPSKVIASDQRAGLHRWITDFAGKKQISNVLQVLRFFKNVFQFFLQAPKMFCAFWFFLVMTENWQNTKADVLGRYKTR